MLLDVLEKSFLFQGIARERIAELLAGIPYHIRSYEKDETLFQPFAQAEWIGIILKGSVQSYKLFGNGNQVNVTIRKKGDVIGPAAALSFQQKYPFGVAALEETKVLLIHRDDYLRLLAQDEQLSRNALQEIASITYLLHQRLELLSYHGIRQKIACYLLTESLQNGTSSVQLPRSMTQWAQVLNVSRPSLHRELKQIEEQGQIEARGKKIEIIDRQALENLLCS